jgi:methylmalonyl-CoA mutase cobalamin-binding domain/chain
MPASRSSTPACTRRLSRSRRPSYRKTPTLSACRSCRVRTSRDDVLVFGGGVIPTADIPVLKQQGVAEIFTPGANLSEVSSWLEQALDGLDREN